MRLMNLILQTDSKATDIYTGNISDVISVSFCPVSDGALTA